MLEVHHASIPTATHEKVFIDSVIRNTSIATQCHPLDSDDNNESSDESDDDVDWDSDTDSSSYDADSDSDPSSLPSFDQLNISY